MEETGYCYVCGAKITGLHYCSTCSYLVDECDVRALVSGTVIINGYVSGNIHELKDDANKSTLFYGVSSDGTIQTTVYETRCEALHSLHDKLQYRFIVIPNETMEDEAEQ